MDCCNQNCNQGRSCPVREACRLEEEGEPVPDSEVVWLLLPFIVTFIGAVGLAIVIWL